MLTVFENRARFRALAPERMMGGRNTAISPLSSVASAPSPRPLTSTPLINIVAERLKAKRIINNRRKPSNHWLVTNLKSGELRLGTRKKKGTDERDCWAEKPETAPFVEPYHTPCPCTNPNPVPASGRATTTKVSLLLHLYRTRHYYRLLQKPGIL